MKNLKRGVKWGVRTLAPKMFNLLVILGLVFQPVGPAGVYSVALAIDDPDAVDAVSTDTTKSDPEPAPTEKPKEEPAVVKEAAPAQKVDVPAPAPEEPVAPVVEDPVVQAPAVTPAADSVLPTNAGSDVAENDESDASEGQESDTKTASPVDSVIAGETPVTETPVTEEKDDTERGVWHEGVDGAMTIAVEEGEEYEFKDSGLKIAFTKIVGEPGEVTVKKLTLTSGQMDELGAASETAWDITSTMENGSFEYDLTLPLAKDADPKEVGVKYVEEKTDLDNSDKAEAVENGKVAVDTEKDEVTVDGLDHFTTFFVTTYSNSTFTVEKSPYYQGETVYVKGGGLNTSKYYRLVIDRPTGTDVELKSCFKPSSSTVTSSYQLPLDATVSQNWYAELKGYDGSSCNGSIKEFVNDKFSVIEPPYTPTRICHATGSESNPYISNTPNNSGQLMGHAGDSHQDGEDIIPPIPYYLPNGQNWDAEGQAIWNNDCKVELKGGLNVIKTVDDHSDLTKWSFKLDNGSPIKANAQGLVDFGQVTTGAHTIAEVGPNAYTNTVSGENCTQKSSLSAEATVEAGQTTTCTFSNLVNKGTITVIKDALPDGPQDFSFSGSLGAFSLDDDTDSTLSNTKVSAPLLPGTYMITEADMDGWALSDISCLSGERKVGEYRGNGVSLSVQPAENIVCTFTNMKKSHITIVKDALPDGPEDFSFYTNFDTDQNHHNNQHSFSLDDDNDKTLPNSRTFELPAGKTYTVQEGMKNGWQLVDISCSNDVDEETEERSMEKDGLFDGSNPRTATIALGVGEDVTCTFTNTKPGEVTVTKVNDANGNGRVDRGERSMGGWTMHLGDESQTTSWNGSTTFEDVIPGQYQLSETLKEGWTQTAILCSREEDHHDSCDEGHHDDNRGFSYGDNKQGDDSHGNDGHDCGDDRDEHGDDNKDGGFNSRSMQSEIDTKMVEVGPGEKLNCQVLNTRATGEIVVKKVIDMDGNLETTEDQSPAAGWEFTVAGTIDDMNVSQKGTTAGETGSVAFDALKTGTYSVAETPQAGYDLVAADCGVENGSQDGDTVYGVRVGQDAQVVCTFYNVPKGSIHGTKWNDCNGNGEWDGEGDVVKAVSVDEGNDEEADSCRETGLSGVTVYLDLDHDGRHDEDEPSDVTDEEGYYEFTGLAAGNYSVQEEVPEDWRQTSNVCAGYVRNNDERLEMLESNESDGVNISAGSQIDCPIGNMESPNLSIEKENNVTGPMQPGATVHYRIKVKAHDNDVRDVTVTDLPPHGFTYVGGSALASQGGLDHVYASPGIWDLGDMAAGQTITLEYDTVIAADQDPGDYKDLAYAVGSSETGENDVLADDLIDADNFVGTRVAVIVPEHLAITVPEDHENKIKEKTKKKTKYVLGASTTLPMTGGGMGSVALGITLLLSGLGLLALSRRKSLSFTIGGRTIVLSIAALMALTSAGTADAASLAVQIEEPEAIVSSPDFKIGFVVLDISNGTPAVTCQVDNGGGFVAFPAAHIEYAAQPGGNSGNCVVDAAVMPADGDYTFRVMADGTPSNTAPVKLVMALPGTPYDYDRNDASCMNNISFHTAADSGKTVKVELYRSASTSFAADASTKVTETAIGSDAAGSFSVAAPGCSDDFFYAIRAVDMYGFGSAFVGDKDRDVDTHTVTNTKTKIVETAGPAVGAIPVAAGEGTEGAGQVEGASTITEDEEGAAAKEGAVLGDATSMEEAGSWMGEHPWQTGFGILILIALIAYVYRQWRDKRSEQ